MSTPFNPLDGPRPRIDLIIISSFCYMPTRGGPCQHGGMCGCKQCSNDVNESNYNMQPITIQLAVRACETKLSNDQATYSFLPPNYIAYRKDRNEHGGGVMLAHKDYFTLSQPPFLRYVTGESVWTRLHTQSSKRPTYLCSCYIPNTHSAVTGLEHLRDSLSLIFSHHRHTQPLIYIAGDFNLGDIDWTNNVTTNPQTATYHQRLLGLMD